MSVYLKAAKLVNDFGVQLYSVHYGSKVTGYPSCVAISRFSFTFNKSGSRKKYNKLFSPDGMTEDSTTAWGEFWGGKEESLNCRVLALLFAHAMRQAGDL